MSKKETNINKTLAGDWSKPMNTLIEKIADATGAIFEPYQKVRLAKADIEVSKVLNNINDLNDIQTRAIRRMIEIETRKQMNLEKILKKASKRLSKKSQPKDLDDDWINVFIDKGVNISNESMQEHWAMILSSEVNNPGKFSKKTLEIMATLEKNDAEVFSKLCQFTIELSIEGDKGFCAYILSIKDNPICNEICYADVMHLESLGLINYNSNFGDTNIVNFRHLKDIQIEYGNRILEIKPKWYKKNFLIFGDILLTRAGEELCEIIEKDFNKDYYQYIKRTLKKRVQVIEN